MFHHIEMISMVADQPVPLHQGQLVGERTAFHTEIVRQLLAVVGDIEGVAAGALDAFREI